MLHASCFKKSDLIVVDEKVFCKKCLKTTETLIHKYNPFTIITKSESNKFYDDEPSDYIESVSEISKILEQCSIFSAKQFNDLIAKNSVISSKSNFSSFFLNVDGNLSNFDSFVAELERYQHRFSVIGIAETNTDQCNSELYQIPGYNSCYQNKKSGKHKGSGVALYIKSELNYVINSRLSMQSDHLETIFVEVTNTPEPVLVGSIYRPPNGNFNEFYREMEAILTKIGKTKSYIMGDYNIDLFTREDSRKHQFEELVFSSGFAPIISTATHEIPGCKSTCIDNILCNDFSQIIASGSLSDKILHHSPIFQCSKLSKNIKTAAPTIVTQYYDYSNTNIELTVENFSKKVNQLYCEFKLDKLNQNVDDKFNKFDKEFKSSIDECCKLKVPKTGKRNQINNPWITPGLKISIDRKHELRKEWQKTITKKNPYGDNKRYTKFCEYRKHVKKIRQFAKLSYHKRQFTESEGNLKKTWQLINEIRGKKKKSIKPIFKIDDKLIENRRIIANKFNEYFTSLATNLNKTVENEFGLQITKMPSFENFLTKKCKKSIFLSECSSGEIQKIISEFDNGKASDIPVRIVKAASMMISPLLETLYNSCIDEGTFPTILKNGKISPVYKKGDDQLLENYRPVSTLPIFGKIFEKIIYERLYKFFISQGSLQDCQFGFRKSHSTTHALNYSVSAVSNSLKNDNHVIGIFIDLSKAFDTIDHHKLLHKLDHYGIRGVAHKLLSSYLFDRKQYTEVLGECSDHTKVEFGVPQGSVLGPLLFLLYVNDIVNCTNDAKFVLYADDTNIFVFGKTQDEVVSKANDVLSLVSSYMMVNQLHINLAKSYFMNFGCKNKSSKLNNNKIRLFLNNVEIKEVNEIKFLGVIIDKNLSWGPHLSYLSKKLSSCIGALNRMKHAIPENLNNSLYHTLFESHLSYGISVWGGVGNSRIEELFTLQKKCMRLMFGNYENFVNKFKTCARARPFGKQFLDYTFFEKEHTKPLFTKEKLLTVHNLYVYHCLLEIIKILKLRTPIGLYSHLNISVRKPTLLIINVSSNTFINRAAKLWNNLRLKILEGSNDFSMKLTHLKSNVKNFLTSNQSKLSDEEWFPQNYSYC